MVGIRARRLAMGVLGSLLWAVLARGEIIQRIQSGIEDIARGMDYVGQRAGEVLGPGVDFSQGVTNAFVARRTFDEEYSLGPAATVMVSNEFGEIQVKVWDERQVRITAAIVAGADTAVAAEQVVQLMEVRVTPGMDHLECRTHLPEIQGGSQVSMVVNYQMTIPRDAGLVVDNFFGDVRAEGLGGAVVADVQYGGLTLSEIAGTVRAQVLGEFPVKAEGLKQGGSFKLQNASAEFSDFGGELSVQHFRGAVSFRQPAPQAILRLSSDSGQARIVLPPHTNPDLNATLSYGKLESELDVTRQLRGRQLLARHPNIEADLHISITAACSDISIEVEGSNAEEKIAASEGFKAFTDVMTETIPLSEDNSMVISAIPGNIYIEGVDDDQVALSATRVVWTPSAAAGMDALEALVVETQPKPGTIALRTAVQQDMTAFKCQSYRVDLNVQVPRSMPVTIQAAEGITTLESVGAGAQVKQHKGEVIIERGAGLFKVANDAGAISLKDCQGTAEISARYGVTTLERFQGNVRIDAEEGRTYIDTPGGDIYLRNRRGDARLLSLEPIRGNYDMLVEEGNLSVFIAPASNAEVTIRTENGRVQSALPLSGSLKGEVQEFFGRFNDGTYTLRLESRNGDVLLN